MSNEDQNRDTKRGAEWQGSQTPSGVDQTTHDDATARGGQGSTGSDGTMGGQGWQDPNRQDQSRGSGSDESTTESAMHGEREETSRS
jgi:hypothetical protein